MALCRHRELLAFFDLLLLLEPFCVPPYVSVARIVIVMVAHPCIVAPPTPAKVRVSR